MRRTWTELSFPELSLSHPCRSQIPELRSVSGNRRCGRLRAEFLSRTSRRRPYKQRVGLCSVVDRRPGPRLTTTQRLRLTEAETFSLGHTSWWMTRRLTSDQPPPLSRRCNEQCRWSARCDAEGPENKLEARGTLASEGILAAPFQGGGYEIAPSRTRSSWR